MRTKYLIGISLIILVLTGLNSLVSAVEPVIIEVNGREKAFMPGNDYRIHTYLIVPDLNGITPEYTYDEVYSFENPDSSVDITDTPLVKLGSTFSIRGVCLQSLTIQPVFRNESGTFIARRFQLQVPDDQAFLNTRYLSTTWAHLISRLAVNYPSSIISRPPHLLIITANTFLSTIEDLVHWKKSRGIRTTVVPLNQIGESPSAEDIRNFISNAYNYWEYPPDYLLLVGDENRIPVYWLYTSDPITIFSDVSFPGWYTSDIMYGCVAGDDYFPEIFVGRFSGATTVEIATMVEKTIEYESDPQTFNPDFYHRAIVASDYSYPSQRQTKLHTRQIMLDHGYTHVDTLFTPGHVNNMLQWINNGRAIINYRGAGWSSGWLAIDFETYHINLLQNFHLLPVVFGIGCGVAIITDPDRGFGETWMVAGTPTNPKGSVAFVGPTWNTHTLFNNQLDIGIMEAIFIDSLSTMGDILLAGKLKLWNHFDDYIPTDQNIEDILNLALTEYNMLNDPSLIIRTRYPEEVHLNVEPTVAQIGTTNFQLTVTDSAGNPLPGVLCTLYSSEDSLWEGISDNDGQVLLTTHINNLPVELVASAFSPYIKPDTLNIPVVSNAQFLQLQNLSYQEQEGNLNQIINPGETFSLQIQVKNWGLSPSYNVVAHLNAADTLSTIIMDSSFISFVDILDTASAQIPFLITFNPAIKHDTTAGFLLTLTDSANLEWNIYFTLPVKLPFFQFVTCEVPETGNGITRGDTSRIAIRIQNTGATNSDTLLATLTTSTDSLLIVQQTVIHSPMESHSENILYPFTVFLPDYVFDRDSLPAHLQITSQDVCYTYSQELEIFIPITPTVTDPGRDAQGFYYCLDQSDTDFSDCPDFQWREISPLEGGPGETIPYPGQIIPTPFSFSFYNQPVTEITVTHQGYLTLGPLDVLRFENSPLPSPNDGMKGTVAPLWYDLGNGDSYDVSFFHDQEEHLLIIEWNNIPHRHQQELRETFEVIIYDPEYTGSDLNPTIDFLYKELSSEMENTFPATAGIESPDEQAGITAIFNNHRASWCQTISNNSVLRFTTSISLGSSQAMTDNFSTPSTFQVYEPFPNPFNQECSIPITIPSSGSVYIQLYDLKGRLIKSHVDYYSPGKHTVKFKGENLPSGIYLLDVRYKNYTRNRKILLLK